MKEKWNKYCHINKAKAFLVIVMAVIVFITVILMALPNREYSYATDKDAIGKTGILADNISLPTGVYRFLIPYNISKDNGGYIEVTDGGVFAGGIKANGEILYANRDKTDFLVYLFESTETLELRISNVSDENLILGDLNIIETDYLWLMLLSCEILLAVAVLFVASFAKHRKACPAERRKEIFGLSLIILISALPFLFNSIFTGADLGYHLARVEGVKHATIEGYFPVRIEPSMFFNRGYADGIFYSDLFLYIPALLRMLGFNISVAYNVFAILVVALTAVIAYNCFSKIFVSVDTGLICAALYTTSSNMTFMTMEGLLGQRVASAFLPVLMLAYFRLFSEDRKSKEYKSIWLLFVAGYSGTIQNHVLTCEITLIWTVVVCLIFAKKVFRKETFMELIKGAFGTAIANLWFLVPFLDYYLSEDITIRHYGGRKIQDRGVTFDEMSSLFGLINEEGSRYRGVGIFFLASAFAAIALIVILWKKEEKKKLRFAATCVALFIASMAFSLRSFPWDQIHDIPGLASLVGNIQFPYRFLTWGTAFGVAIIGFVIDSVKDKRVWRYITISLAVVSIFVNHFTYLDYEIRNTVRTPLYDETMIPGYIAGAEYIHYGTNIEGMGYGKVGASEGIILSYTESGYLKGTAVIEENVSEGYVEFPLMYYKGYKAWDETGEKLTCGLGTNNVVRVEIPNGYTGEIKVKFVSPWYWRVSEWISLAFIAWMIISISRQRKTLIRQPVADTFPLSCEKGEGKIKAKYWGIYGAVIYLTSPYMLYLLFEAKSLSGVGAYVLCPILILAFFYRNEFKNIGLYLAINAVGTALLMVFKPVWGIMFLFAMIDLSMTEKKWRDFVSSFAGFVIGSIVNLDFWKFVLLGSENKCSVPLKTIGAEGYFPGQFFMNWTFFEGHPGIGFGMGISLIALIWLLVFEREKSFSKDSKVLIWSALVLTVLSMRWPIWDMAARVSPIILRFLSYVGSPRELFGFALSLILIPTVCGTKKFNEKGYGYVSYALPIFGVVMSVFAFAKWIILYYG